MKAVIVNEGGSLSLEDIDIPKITSPDQILVKIAYCGLCGSDISRIFHHGAHFYPITLGHEFSGTVIETGNDVTEFDVGDLISCVPLLPCFKCDECQKHYYSLCKNYTFVGSRIAGGFAEYIVLNKKNAFKLPKGVSPLEGAFFEPMTVGMHALLLAGGCQNKHVVIVGGGTIGLLAMLCAKAMGASSIAVLDINDERLNLAKQLGADVIYNSKNLSSDEIYQALSSNRFDQIVLETAGSPITVRLAIEIAGPRSKVCLVGTLHNDFTLPEKTFGLILRKELQILGSWMNYSAPWPGEEWLLVSQFFVEGKINLNELIAVIGDFNTFIHKVRDLNGQSMNGKILLNCS
ncbi:alcohol dehydrogenase catalytic domain-containing protein [Gilliamella apicola]|uniref:alcohol dehydrogenase catalytic domain-containing protein n=1 Tax=Gilliamella apicola TaxID=1196095 RepID=UPI000A019820|nr:alcohol dehydrogenase catalytic domain-containing protein [Gilliamella apicola]ORF46385.1 galactitol-1-phosphate 5-dehydrogenase [Gilliamella apicola]ORF50532.1 galactitol-1-phosphate 5-dehydrogenase [Gilliamella apicola]ORF55411.1 galactitol-1-phosphate 5-dehydrogenase [Gilliamella apicola]ORF56269.1 galactitol-1-phosphate 5-dehydrogenase [Gilliamella apicola]ORF56758.1 galactitol-1-phosphate 5-dehydrogenase [Gilliamella apicola]